MIKEYEFLMIKLEGFKERAYKDSEDNVTIGIGFNMDMIGAILIWNKILPNMDFIAAYNKQTTITIDDALLLFQVLWNRSKGQVVDRIIELNSESNETILQLGDMPEYKRFILIDIAYNTGNIKNWTNVFFATEYKNVLFEARRKQRYLDSRVAKIGYFYGLINSIEDAVNIGLTETKYI